MSNPAANLLIIRGLPGSGKSTLAKTFTDRVHIETDMYFELDGPYFWEAKRLGKAHKWCQHQVRKALIEGKKVVVSNTFITKKEIDVYRNIAAEFNVSVAIIEQHIIYGNIHGISEDKVKKMKSRWEVL